MTHSRAPRGVHQQNATPMTNAGGNTRTRTKSSYSAELVAYTAAKEGENKKAHLLYVIDW